MKIWMDGEVVDEQNARISVMSHTLHYGTGVFEGIRARRTSENSMVVFRLMDHLARLKRSADAMNIVYQYSDAELCQAVIDVLNSNKLQDAYIRPLVFIGTGSLSLDLGSAENATHIIIAAWKWDNYFSAVDLSGISVVTDVGRRVICQPELRQAKVAGAYANAYIATMVAKSKGADDAILVDENGYIAEAAAANIFIVRGDRLYTPTCRVALAGITRNTISHLAAPLGFKVYEYDVTTEDINNADEIFLTGTAYGIVPVVNVDGKPVAGGKPGSITRQLHSSYQYAVHNRHSFASNVCVEQKMRVA